MAADENAQGRYDPRPVLPVPGLEVLALPDIEQALASLANGHTLVIDGFLGIDWDSIRTWLGKLLAFDHFQFIDARSAMLPQDEIEQRIHPYLGDPDPVFGRLFPGDLEQFFDPQRLALLCDQAHRNTCVVFGPGAGLISESAPVVYLDVSKESLQTCPVVRLNLGQATVCDDKFYKHAYFIDWPLLERHRNALRSRIKLWIDSNNSRLLGLRGADLERAIRAAGERPFRPKPWFLPGPWGGQFLKRRTGVGKCLPNIAWSYELISPENGVLIGDESTALELPFTFMLEANPASILGTEVASHFANRFPIRFDYLDTISGGNLSCQCHPSNEFIQTTFGEPFTQDESYYVVESEPESIVYLGFRDDCDPVDFWKAARLSQRVGCAFDIANYLNAWPSKKHDIFLIPNGTVHCSGTGNLVLEISATPYIYTFKIYDHMRPDLKGRFRHLHIDYAERNAHSERTTAWVQKSLIPGPKLLSQGKDWQEFVVSDNPILFYDIRRVDFSSRVKQQTHGGVTVVNLVEGEEADIISASGTLRIHYAETAVIPAATGVYELVNRGVSKARLLKAFVRPCE
jgi:mannose-6-phosphate isomerase class I